MIIKYTMNDNDFTQVIEQYLEEYGPYLAIFFKTLDEHIEFKRDVAKYDELSNNSPEKAKLKDKLTKLLNQKFIAFINSIKENTYATSLSDKLWDTFSSLAKSLGVIITPVGVSLKLVKF